MGQDIHIIGVRSELGAATYGAGLGVDALQIAALNAGSDLFGRFPVDDVETENRRLYEPISHPFAKRITGVLAVSERVSLKVARALQSGQFPVVLAGDHSTAAGTIAGIHAAHPGVRLGIVWIDAHADLHTPCTTPSGNLHGMPLAAATSTACLEGGPNQPDTGTLQAWQKWVELGGGGAHVAYRDVVYVALRSYEQAEAALIKSRGMQVVTVSTLLLQGVRKMARRILAGLGDCELIYVSFDVDSLDPSVSSGTGTPVARGLLQDEAAALIAEILSDAKTCCLEIAEINPTLDCNNRMAETAFHILEQGIRKRPRKIAAGKTG